MSTWDGVPSHQVEAAGGVLWRGDPAAPEVALVHRPRYGDWSLPKGKLAPGEHPLLGALREIAEETGQLARPGRPLPSQHYLVPEGPKRVRYWACEALGGQFRPGPEVDELSWLAVPAAAGRLAAGRDREVLASFAADTRRTRALVVVRHGSAGDRRRWAGPDVDRPLDPSGRAQARDVADLLRAYGVRRAGTADVLRCRQTLAPYAHQSGVPVEVLPATTAGAFRTDPAAAASAVVSLLADNAAAAWCGQREVVAELTSRVCERLGRWIDPAELPHLGKGAALLLHVADEGSLVDVGLLAGSGYSTRP